MYLLSLIDDLTACMSPLGRESAGTFLSFLWVRRATSSGFMKAILSRSYILTCAMKCSIISPFSLSVIMIKILRFEP